LKAAFLDYASVDPGDLDRTGLLDTVEQWRWFEQTLPGEIAPRIADVDILVLNKVRIGAAELESAPALRLICAAATGVNNIDLDAAQARGVGVANVRAYATPAVVQHVFGMLLALVTRQHEYQAEVRAGEWGRSAQFCLLHHQIRELTGMRLGILGWGELGRGVARVAECFGMQVLVAARPGGGTQSGRVPLPELLPDVDVLSIHTPLADNTRDLIGAAELAAMKPGAILINTARGGIVDEAALAEALRAGHLGGAGVDVLSTEPPVAGNPLLAPDIPHLILTPHTAWASREARQRVLAEIAANIRAYRSGEQRNRIL
jgi:glycerate dehydrogenase